MKTILNASVLAVALTFSAGFAGAYAQQLQSDGTMSQPAVQQQQQPAQQQPAQQQSAPQQEPMRKHAPNPAHEAKRLTKQLGLTPDQTSQLQPILADRDSRMAALHNDTTLDPRTMHKQGHAIELDTQGKINALLTPQQQQLYNDMRAAHHHGPQGAAPAPAPTA